MSEKSAGNLSTINDDLEIELIEREEARINRIAELRKKVDKLLEISVSARNHLYLGEALHLVIDELEKTSK